MRRAVASLLAAYAVACSLGALAAFDWAAFVAALKSRSGPPPAWHSYLFLAGGAGFLLSGALVSLRRAGSVALFLLGAACLVPALTMAEWSVLWWQDPSAVEGAMAGLLAGLPLLFVAVWEMRQPGRPCTETVELVIADDAASVKPTPRIVYLSEPAAGEPSPQPKRRREPPIFVPDIMVERQRALFRAQARARRTACGS